MACIIIKRQEMQNAKQHLIILKLALEIKDEFIIMHELLNLDKEPYFEILTKFMKDGEKVKAIALIDDILGELDLNLDENSGLNSSKNDFFGANLSENLNKSEFLNSNSNLNLSKNNSLSLNLNANSSENLGTKSATSINLQPFVDEEWESLKNRCKDLQEIYAELLESKEAILSTFDDFDREYYVRFGAILREILVLQKHLAKRAQDEERKKLIDELNAQEDELNAQFEHTKVCKINLSTDKQNELKTLYRKGVKQCHPDAIGSDDKTKIYHKLNEAYQNNNLERLKQVIFEIENSAATIIDDKESIRAMIERLKDTIQLIKAEISQLKVHSHYNIITNKTLWEKFFAKEQRNLNNELNALKKECGNLFYGLGDEENSG